EMRISIAWGAVLLVGDAGVAGCGGDDSAVSPDSSAVGASKDGSSDGDGSPGAEATADVGADVFADVGLDASASDATIDVRTDAPTPPAEGGATDAGVDSATDAACRFGLDPTFGMAGLEQLVVPPNPLPHGLALQADGKILVLGTGIGGDG